MHAENLKFQWDCDRRLAGEITENVGRGLPIQLATMVQERDSRGLRVRHSQCHDLEGSESVASDIEEGLCVSRVEIADNGNLSRLCERVRQRLKPLAKAQRILLIMGCICASAWWAISTQRKPSVNPGQLEQGSDGHGVT